MSTIGERIRSRRESRNWSILDLAENSNVHRVMISRYENNEAAPSKKSIRKLAQAFEIPEAELIGRKSDPSIKEKEEKFDVNTFEAQLQKARLLTMKRRIMVGFLIDELFAKEKLEKFYELNKNASKHVEV